ncbi:MAG: glycosyltransferase [Pyrinomonadaceae bacterium]
MKVSLVVPLRNEERSLPNLLESIGRQTFPPAEIILVDGGSSDRTVELAREAATHQKIRVIEAGPATPGRGRNVGIAEASNEWVALTDAGNRLEETWLERLVSSAEADPEIDIVYGNFEPIKDSWFTRCAALAYPPPKSMRPGGIMRGPFIASSLVRRDVWRKIGGFPDLRAAEDLIFMDRVRQAGCKIGWSPNATVWWEMQPDVPSTFRRFELYSRNNVWVRRQWDWHYGLARQYLVAGFLLILGILYTPWWLTAIAALFAARIFRSVWRRREGRGFFWALNPARLAGVGLIVLTIDLATFVGWARALTSKPALGTKSD